MRHGDWRIERIGLNPPAALIELRRDVEATVLAAAGVPVELVRAADSQAAREAWRRFLHSTLKSHGTIVGNAIAAALDLAAVRLDFSDLAASDIQGRARAYGSMVNAGMDKGRAEDLAGLSE